MVPPYSCLGMKEGVGVMEGKEFVCHFCMSACLLTLQREVVGLREELRSAESGNEVAKEIIRAVGKMASGFSIIKRVAELNSKKRWWLVMKAPERWLVEVEEKWKHKHWRWQKMDGVGSDF